MAASAYPQSVDTRVVRGVAAVVCLVGVASIGLVATVGFWALPVLLGADFVVRVVWGPRFSPVAQGVRRVVAARGGSPQLVPAAPKRFAAGIGAGFCVAATAASLAGSTTLAVVLVGVLSVFAFCEAAFGFCAGCVVYGQLVRAGVFSSEVCVECADITLGRGNAN